jgi:putative NIF3 family GTP cyclohydrolase 1 type 2
LEVITGTIKTYLGLDYIRLAKASSKPICRIAICAGSGSSVLEGVAADLYLTGEMSHHEVLSALANNTSVILTEHSNSERGYLSKGIFQFTKVLQPRLLSLLKVDLGLDVESDVLVDVICSQIDRDPLIIA